LPNRIAPNNIPIETLRSFVSILETGSFTKAAGLLNLTQPAISAQMKRMQTMVGEELFQKDGVGIILTEKGEAVCRYARRIIALNDQILSTNRNQKKIRVGLPTTLGGRAIAMLKGALVDEGSQAVQIVVDRSASLQKSLQAGHLDTALFFSLSNAEEKSCCEWQEPLVWVCHPQLVVSPGAPVPLISWPYSVTDQIAVGACDRADITYTTEFVGDQLSVLGEALRLKMGFLCMVERAVPGDMKIARDYFLPKLPAVHAGIYRNIDVVDARLDAIVECLAEVFRPKLSETSRA
jgi:DNA-binding transcriptional LysR family regulator